jgi:hypothetical protein
MLSDQRVVHDQRQRRVLMVAVFVALAAASGFAMGRATVSTVRASRAAVMEQPIPWLGPMSPADRTRYRIYRKLNIIGPEPRGTPFGWSPLSDRYLDDARITRGSDVHEKTVRRLER